MAKTVEEIFDIFYDNVYHGIEHGNVDTFEDDVVYDLSRVTSFTYFSGATKMVFDFADCEKDVVFKIPFRHKGLNFYEEDETYCDFEFADNGVNDWDYCLTEKKLYDSLKPEFKKFFLSLEIVDYIGEVPVYIQPRAKSFCDCQVSYTRPLEERERISKMSASYDIKIECFDWLVDFEKFYGEESLRILFQLIYDYDIADLHTGNVGYLFDGTPVIMDYAGFRD